MTPCSEAHRLCIPRNHAVAFRASYRPQKIAASATADSNDKHQTGTLDAARTVQNYLNHIKERDFDALLAYVPDDIIDECLRRKEGQASSSHISFKDVLSTPSLYLDTYATRCLVHAAPHSMTVLSSMAISTDRFLQRCAVVAPSGEECTLTFTLERQDCLEPQYGAPPLVTKRWMLKSVVGEACCDELPSHPSPSFPPEAVVQAQLQALRRHDIPFVFAFASPQNKAVTGPYEAFAAMLERAYRPLLGHSSAEVINQLQVGENTYMALVAVHPDGQGGGLPLLFKWVVSRQSADSVFAHCWMSDSVQQIPVQYVRQWGGSKE